MKLFLRQIDWQRGREAEKDGYTDRDQDRDGDTATATASTKRAHTHTRTNAHTSGFRQAKSNSWPGNIWQTEADGIRIDLIPGARRWLGIAEARAASVNTPEPEPSSLSGARCSKPLGEQDAKWRGHNWL